MTAPPPCSAPRTATMASTASHPPPRGRELALVIKSVFLLVVIMILVIFGLHLIIASYPKMRVAAFSVSNLSAAASTGATWKAAVLAEWPEDQFYQGRFLFRDVEVFIYHHWDTAQPLAVSLVEPFELRSNVSTVIKAKMTMEGPEVEVAEDMDRERRAVGTVIVGLGMRMRITFMYGSWWKRSFGHVEARCDDLRIVFANSTTDGSTVEGGLEIRDDPNSDINLPSCTFV